MSSIRVFTKFIAKLTWLSKLQGLLLPVILLLVWDFLSHKSNAYSYAFVPLPEIWAGFVTDLKNGELLQAAYGTVHTAMIGLLIGSTAGFLIGSLMGVFRIADLLIGPLYHAIRQVPLVGWIPLIGLWLGNGETSELFMVSIAALFPMGLNTYEGIRHVEQKYLEVGRIYQFSRFQQFFRIILPAALPSVLTGLVQALAFAWLSTVGSELLFTNGAGLGGLMETSQMASRMDMVVVCIASIGIVGLVLNSSLQRLSNHLLRWRQVA